MSKPPRCPHCGKKSEHARGGLFRCLSCGGLHDGDPNEGKDFDDRNPAARIEREEKARSKFNKRQ